MAPDFTSLYPKALHKKHLSAVYEFIDVYIDESGNTYVAVTKFGDKWISEQSTYPTSCAKKTCKKAVKYLFEKYFFEFIARIYQQIIDIPVGSDPVPLMIKLFFYIMTISSFEISRAFEKTLYEIYTSELKLKKENKSNSKLCF